MDGILTSINVPKVSLLQVKTLTIKQTRGGSRSAAGFKQPQSHTHLLQTEVLCLGSDAFFVPLTKDHLPDLALPQQKVSNSLKRQSWA